MLKFLRKYNTIIMVVGGVLLMIAFLLPQAIQQIGSRVGDKAVATLDGREIKSSDIGLAEREISVLQRLARVPTASGVQSLVDVMVDPDYKAEHWLLLTEAADRAGFVGDAEHGRGFLDELAQTQIVLYFQALMVQQVANPAMAMALAQQQFESEEGQRQYREQRTSLLRLRSEAANQARMLPEDVDRALAKLRGVQRMQAEYIGSLRMSSVEAQRVASYYTDTVVADVLPLSADALADPLLNPTDEQLEAHFQQYKALRPGEEGPGFGYRLPDRVKLQWIALDRQAISDAVQIDVLAIAKAHQANRTRYVGTLTDERTRIESDLRNERVKVLLDLAEQTIKAEIGRLTLPLAKDDEYKVLPADWTTPDLIAIASTAADAVRTKESMPSFPTPRVVRRDAQWLDARKLSELDGIGRASIRTTDARQQVLPMIALALSVRELEPEVSQSIQVGIPFTRSPLEDFMGNRYILTVTDAAEEGVPDSLGELIDPQVVRDDWRTAQAYAFLLAQQASLESLAVESGLDAVADALFPPDITEESERPVIQRGVEFGISQIRSGNARARYDTDAVRDAVRAKADSLDPVAPMADVIATDRTLAVPAEEARVLLMVRIIGLSPLTVESFRQLRDQAIQRGVQDDIRESEVLATPFAFKELSKTLNYELREGSARRDRGKQRESDAPAESDEG